MDFEKQIEKFYVAWSPSVLALCCLLLGGGTEAEQISVEAFHAYLSRGLDLDVGQLPSLLFVFALDAAKRAPLPSMPRVQELHSLEEAVVSLPWKERSVFALRSVMGLDNLVISEIVEIPVREVQRIWMNALFHLRELLHKDFSQGERNEGCHHEIGISDCRGMLLRRFPGACEPRAGDDHDARAGSRHGQDARARHPFGKSTH